MISTQNLKKACWVALVALCSIQSAYAQDKFPSRPIDMIVNYSPGGGADKLGRAVAPLLEKELGVPIKVSNITGASGNAGLAAVSTARPDGYTIGTMTGIFITLWANNQGELTGDDFTFLTVIQESPSMMFVPADSPFDNYGEMLDYAKANPNKLKIAVGGLGGTEDMAVKYLTSAGYPMVSVPYSKNAERYTSPLGGHTDGIYEEPGDVRQFIDAGQYRPLVVYWPSRHPDFPDVPPATDFGQDYKVPQIRAFVTAPNVPEDRVAVLNAAFQKVMKTAEWKKFCARTYTCAEPRTSAASKKFVYDARKNTHNLLKELGLLKN